MKDKLNKASSIEQEIQKIKKFFSGGLFKKRVKSAVGVDIGNRSVKIVELEKKSNHIELKNYAIGKIKQDLLKAGTTGVISNQTGDVIAKMLNEAGIKTKSVNVSIPSFASLVSVIELPLMSNSEIDQVIRAEAPKYIPVKLSEVVYDWEIIYDPRKKEESAEKKKEKSGKGKILSNGNEALDGKFKILIVAIMKEISDRYEKVLVSHDLAIDALEIDSFSLVRSLVGNDGGCYLILDIGHKVCNILVVSESSILNNRSIDVAGARMTRVIERGMGLDQQRAEQVKIEQGVNLSSNTGPGNLLAPTLGLITDETKKTIEILNKDYPHLQVKNVILTGGGSRMIGLKEFIEKEVGISTIMGNPLAKVKYPKEIEKVVKNHDPFFAVAVGLAMLNFEEQ